MSVEQVANAVDIAIHKLPHMESLYEQVKEQVEKTQHTRQGLVNDIQALKYKISILDTPAFFCEQVRRRKHQEIQELIAQKDRIERLIANILKGEGYSQLKVIVKENVKAVLTDNKKLILVSFVALIQTLKADLQLANLICNIPGANDGEQHQDNDINITKYLEFNKAKLLDLAEKHYGNLVEEFTENAIDTVGSTSLNLTLSLQQPSSTFSNSFDQIDSFRKEESESFDNSNGDIE